MEGLGQVTAQVEKLTREAQSIRVLSEVKTPSGVVAFSDKTGTLRTQDIGAGFTSHRALNPEALHDLIEASGGETDDSIVFVYETGILFAPNRNDLRNNSRVVLRQSTQFAWLSQFAGQGLPQKQLAQALRITFNGCLSVPDLPKSIARIEWMQTASGQSEVKHGADSWGKSVNAQVGGIAAIPEEFIVTVPVWENWSAYRATIRCAIEIDTANQKFSINPYPQEMQKAIQGAMAAAAVLFDNVALAEPRQSYKARINAPDRGESDD